MDERDLKEDLVPVPTHGQRVSILVAGEETGGRFALVEMVEERGSEAPCHLHHWEDETLCVLEGSLSVWVAGRWVEAPAGAAVFLERGVEHALAVAAEGARVLSFFAPAGVEGFYRELGATSAPTSSATWQQLPGTAARSSGRPPKGPGVVERYPG